MQPSLLGFFLSLGDMILTSRATPLAQGVEGAGATGSKACDGTGGCNLEQQASYNIGVTIEVGARLGLDLGAIASLGVSASVSYSTETQEVSGAEKRCPDGAWQCSLIVYPSMLEVSGVQMKHEGAACSEKKAPYTVLLPKSGTDQTSTAGIDVCACGNFPRWADAGAPSIVCPQDYP